MPEIEFEGFDELYKLIEDMPDMAKIPAEKAMYDALLVLHAAIPSYPPAPATNIYIRTGTLGRRITEDVLRTNSGEVIGLIGMLTPYAPWVVGDPKPGEYINGELMFQKPTFKRRGWWRFNEVMQDNTIEAWKEFSESFIVYFAQELNKHN